MDPWGAPSLFDKYVGLYYEGYHKYNFYDTFMLLSCMNFSKLVITFYSIKLLCVPIDFLIEPCKASAHHDERW